MSRLLQPLPLQVLIVLIVGILAFGALGSWAFSNTTRTPIAKQKGTPLAHPSPPALIVTPPPYSTPPQASATPTPTSTYLPKQSIHTSLPTTTSSTQRLGYDLFDRSLETFWGHATDGQTWKGDANSSESFAVEDHTGTIEGVGTWNALLGPQATNVDMTMTGSIEDFAGGNNNFGAVLRWSDSQHFYKVYLNGSSLILFKQDGSEQLLLGYIPFLALANVSYRVHFQVRGEHLFARAWISVLPEPSFWQIEAIDSSLSTGYAGIRVLLQDDSTNVCIRQFEAKSLPA